MAQAPEFAGEIMLNTRLFILDNFGKVVASQ